MIQKYMSVAEGDVGADNANLDFFKTLNLMAVADKTQRALSHHTCQALRYKTYSFQWLERRKSGLLLRRENNTFDIFHNILNAPLG